MNADKDWFHHEGHEEHEGSAKEDRDADPQDERGYHNGSRLKDNRERVFRTLLFKRFKQQDVSFVVKLVFTA